MKKGWIVFALVCVCMVLDVPKPVIAGVEEHFTLKGEGSYLEFPVSLNPETYRVAEGIYGGSFEILKKKNLKLILSGQVKTVLRRDKTREGLSLFRDGALSVYYKIVPELSLRLNKRSKISLGFTHWCYHYLDNHTEDVIGRENFNMFSLGYKKISPKLPWKIFIDVNQNNRIISHDWGIRCEITKNFKKLYLNLRSEFTSDGKWLAVQEIGTIFPARYGSFKIFLMNINTSGFFLSEGKVEKGIYVGFKIEFS